MAKLGVQDLPVEGKRVLIRVDFNVPQDENGNITDDTRIVAALPTIQNVLERGGKPILMSHLGRPKGKEVPALTLAPCAKRLSRLLGIPVHFGQGNGRVVLLENLRFNPAEEKPEKDPNFAKELAALGDCYVNDAFGTAHRAHSSTVTITQYFPDAAAAGFLLQKEIAFLGESVAHPKRPFAAIVGGAKVSSKLGVLKALLEKADFVLIGGAMAFTFLKAKGIDVGKSLVEDELVPTAKELLDHPGIHLPIDVRIAEECKAGVASKVVDVSAGIPADMMGLDSGPKTTEEWSRLLADAKTILWNGPLGVFEIPEFAEGTLAMAQILAKSDATTIVGGGDSVAAVKQAGLSEKMSHISTGGGASLEYIENGTLPGLESLTDI